MLAINSWVHGQFVRRHAIKTQQGMLQFGLRLIQRISQIHLYEF